MTKEEAWKIIEENRNFSIQFWPSGMTKLEEDILLARKKAIAKAWATVGEVGE